jgi:hypothetical protein
MMRSMEEKAGATNGEYTTLDRRTRMLPHRSLQEADSTRGPFVDW